MYTCWLVNVTAAGEYIALTPARPAGQAYLTLVLLLDKDVLWFEISVNDFLGMEELNSLLCIIMYVYIHVHVHVHVHV